MNSNQDFLNRFQNRISTITAHGNLRHDDGHEEIRVGPRRKIASNEKKHRTRTQPISNQDSTNVTNASRYQNIDNYYKSSPEYSTNSVYGTSNQVTSTNINT